MTSLSVVRLQVSPWRDVTQAERVKTRPRLGVGAGMWRLTLSCGHLVMPLRLVADIASATPHGVPCAGSAQGSARRSTKLRA